MNGKEWKSEKLEFPIQLLSYGKKNKKQQKKKKNYKTIVGFSSIVCISFYSKKARWNVSLFRKVKHFSA